MNGAITAGTGALAPGRAYPDVPNVVGPASEIDQELYSYENLTEELGMELAALADRLNPVLSAGINKETAPDAGMPRNSTIARRLNSTNSSLYRLVCGIRALRNDVQL